MRVLVTGFEPFGGYSENSSWEVAQKVASCAIKGAEVVAEQLPVSFARVADALQAMVEQHTPDLIIMLGQSAVADRIKLERVALNMKDSAMGDNDGVKPASQLNYDVDFSTIGTQSCSGRIPTKGAKTIYLGFENERMRYVNYIWVEAVAITPTTEYYTTKYSVQ